MTDIKIIEAMASIEGLSFDGFSWRTIKTGAIKKSHVHYLTDHNAVQRVIDDMDSEWIAMYGTALWEMFDRPVPAFDLYRATPRQKCEAVLKAKGVWYDQ